MGRRLRILITALAAALSIARASAGTWEVATPILGYDIWDSGSASINVANSPNPDSCTTTRYLSLDTSQPFFNQMYATILSAYATGTPVSLYYNGCLGPYPKISAIAVPAIW